MAKKSERSVCAYPWQQMVIDLTGEVVPCCFWSGYGNGGKPVGNTNSASIDEIWNGNAYQEMRRRNASGDLKGTPCHECVAYRWGNDRYPGFSWPVEYTREQGHCFTTALPQAARDAAAEDETVMLCEDGEPLPYPEAIHEEIRELGKGRYSVWGDTLYFSTSDGTDPATSGRSYELVFAEQRIKLAGLDRESTSGRNLLTAFDEYHSGTRKVASKPSMISFISTSDCNIDCPGCSQNLVRLLKVQHRSETEPDVLDHVQYLHQFIWHGGEPYLIKGFREFIENFKRSDNPNLTFGFTTNGTMLNEAELDKLEKFPRINASISIDSFNKETFEVIRAGGDYDRIIRNALKAISRYQAPERVFSVGMIVLKRNFLELPANLKFAFEHDIGLNLSPVLVTPVHERLDIFQNFAEQTVGWRGALDEAREILEQARADDCVALKRVDPKGMLEILDDTLESARRRYRDVIELCVNVRDPNRSLERMRNPGMLVNLTRAPEMPLSYVTFDGEGMYTLSLPRAELSGAGNLQWYFVHDIDEPMGILDSDFFRDAGFEPLINNGWKEMPSRLELEVPKFSPPPRARRNVLVSNRGLPTPDGRWALGGSDLWEAYQQLLRDDARAGFGLAETENPLRTINKRSRKLSTHRYSDYRSIGG